MRSFLIAILISVTVNGLAQPYVDPFHLRYSYGTKNNNGSGTPYNHIYIGPDFPLKLRNNGFFVISPVYERWNIDSASEKSYLPEVNSFALALSVVIPLDNNQWTLTVSGIPRVNGEEFDINNNFQLGGVLLATHKKNERLK